MILSSVFVSGGDGGGNSHMTIVINAKEYFANIMFHFLVFYYCSIANIGTRPFPLSKLFNAFPRIDPTDLTGSIAFIA
jgi:hypothetical protein